MTVSTTHLDLYDSVQPDLLFVLHGRQVITIALSDRIIHAAGDPGIAGEPSREVNGDYPFENPETEKWDAAWIQLNTPAVP